MATRCCSFFLTSCKVAHIQRVCMELLVWISFSPWNVCLCKRTSAQKTVGVLPERLKMLREVSPADEKQPKVPLGLYNTWGEYIQLERAGERGEGEPSNSFSHAEHGCWTHLSNHRPQNRHIYHRSSTSHPPMEDYTTDTLQTDRRHGMLHHRIAERVRCSGVWS